MSRPLEPPTASRDSTVGDIVGSIRDPSPSISDRTAGARPANEDDDNVKIRMTQRLASTDTVIDEKLKQIQYDPNNPHTWPLSTRWMHTIFFSLLAGASFFPSGAYGPGTAQIEREFGVSIVSANLGLTMFPLGFTVGPLVMAPLSELYGRLIVFKLATAVAIVFTICAALSQNLAMLLVFRFLQALAIAGPFAVAGGAVSDLWPKSQRTVPVVVFALLPNVSSTIGPFIAGAIALNTTWRWIFWLCTIMFGVLYVVLWLAIRETYVPKLRGEIVLTRETLNAKLTGALKRPFVLLFTEPIVLALSVYIAFVYALIFGAFAAFPVAYQRNRGWDVFQGGYAFLGLATGVVIAALLSTVIKLRLSHLESPESRLWPGTIGAVLLPASLFWWGATSAPSVPGVVSIIAAGGIGASLMFLFLSITDYLVEAYLVYAASALAANGATRTIVSAMFPLFTRQMFLRLGTDWAAYLLAFISLAMLPIPFILLKYGHKLRLRGRFAKQMTTI